MARTTVDHFEPAETSITSPAAAVHDHNTRQKGRYYDAPTAIKTVVGVTRREGIATDEYFGTADALTSTGLLPRDRFPGEPGMPACQAFFRPRGVEREPDGCWAHAPGYLQVFRNPKGSFRIVLNVSTEERARRQLIADRKRSLVKVDRTARNRAGDFFGSEAKLFEDQREGETEYADRLFLQLAFIQGPMDADGARKAAIEDIERSIYSLKKSLGRYAGPFLLKPSEEEREDLDEAIETIRRLAHYGRLVRDTAMSARIVQYRAAKAASEDKSLQTFLAKVAR